MTDSQSNAALRVQLRQAREQARISRAELARRLGISAVQVGRIENGRRGTSIDLAHRWFLECGYSVESVSVGEPQAAQLVAIAVASLSEDQLKACARVIRVWGRLPAHIITGILALIGPYEVD